MYCKNCGNEMDPNAQVCVKCGVPKGVGTSFCPNCGNQTAPNAAVCLSCGTAMTASVPEGQQKSKMAAGLLAIFLGSFGIHNFYLGNIVKAVIQLVVWLLGWFLCGIPSAAISVLALIEGIMILTGKIDKDAKGNPLA